MKVVSLNMLNRNIGHIFPSLEDNPSSFYDRALKLCSFSCYKKYVVPEVLENGNPEKLEMQTIFSEQPTEYFCWK